MANRVYADCPDLDSTLLKAIFGSIGTSVKLAGVVFQGQGKMFGLFLPDANADVFYPVAQLTNQEWQAVLKQADNPVYYQEDETGVMKPFIRKAQYALSGEVQQRIWVRDGLACQYCGRKLGEPGVTLSVDHFTPIILGGVNDPSNYLTSCTRCNRYKGDMQPEEWCKQIGKSFNAYLHYLEEKCGIT